MVGSIVYFATDIVEPGVIRHTEGNRISLGEPDGTRSDRCKAISEALIKAGLALPGDAANPHGDLGEDSGQCRVQSDQRSDARDAGADGARSRSVRAWSAISWSKWRRSRRNWEWRLPISIDQRIAGAEKVGEHKTSMLQDLEAGRPMELEAVVGAVVELGERLGVPMPHTRTVYAVRDC